MRHKNKGVILDRQKAPREAMLSNLASSVLIYEKVKTTEAKAKAVKPIVERMITMARKGTLTSRRALIAALLQKLAVRKAMDVLGKRYETRPGGYTRIVRLDRRDGDGAQMVLIELV